VSRFGAEAGERRKRLLEAVDEENCPELKMGRREAHGRFKLSRLRRGSVPSRSIKGGKWRKTVPLRWGQ